MRVVGLRIGCTSLIVCLTLSNHVTLVSQTSKVAAVQERLTYLHNVNMSFGPQLLMATVLN